MSKEHGKLCGKTWSGGTYALVTKVPKRVGSWKGSKEHGKLCGKTWSGGTYASTGNFAAGAAGGGCGAPRSAPATPLQLEPHSRSKHDNTTMEFEKLAVPTSVRRASKAFVPVIITCLITVVEKPTNPDWSSVVGLWFKTYERRGLCPAVGC
ncbi:jg12350 [Pararge aegeria aegeria]|uniref:Jg12350 protein n=1 Tax=Pararge aegeria aegeria TaxID=348720 RepID=A0A8S4R6L9_9NEOP|nr:jg12350 [Pararge aegeria aegeria]